ncbi:hypothetical protein IX307_002055 [Bacteroides pyogenes]|uniref:Uncharacterized protein n=1 Tax=Bacteroides pyogenes TaxID=310300 RepID=A0A5D3FCF6_9BACE|nr:hypothetical protein [Bacteroides pyogenes]MBR8704964.1 hypothetical protein [Bacteroides pyogenes]MBR8708408.1 hypothetical protein [Bacteroides pyogenes]MBR8717004.1 hypothetical protein [Bacteroides pyogenes]MBR8720878.1 hypothetical protein [Bacteroides pyogenes]MBR8725780.1 hypothetical protein [Bacteroides pyogenes]
MKKKSRRSLNLHPECVKRERRMSILLSEDEQLIVDRYLEKYKITNKSRWLRETILMFIHKNMEEDYPTLFGEHDMRR